LLVTNAALSAPSDVIVAAMLMSELVQVLVTWTTPDCSNTSGLVDAFVIEYCVIDDNAHNNCSGS